jgi:methyl-accepting chemotaxis protein-like sensor
MRDWTIARRIGAGYAVVLVLLVATAAVGTYALLHTRDNYRTALATVEQRAIKGTDSLQGSDSVVVAFLSFLVTGTATTVDTMNQRFDDARKDTVELRDSSVTVPQTTGWTEAARQLDVWNTAAQSAVTAKRAGRDEEAVRIYNDQVIPVRRTQRALVVDLVDAERKRAATIADNAAGDAQSSIWLLLGVSAVALIAGILLAWRLGRAVTLPLREAVGTLATASNGILAATAQQASGAAEEETAIHQTTATADEVRQTVALTTEKARAVAREVQETADISRDGRRAVEESVRGTREARARMETLAERILVLSEQAQTIAEVVSTVNALAEQSNLLAVNAGIEAAKAGDAGKGFAVVAGEVKSLADQSKQATAQIRGILNEIQAATQSAVMAAEQGVKASEAGETITAEAGEAIRQLGERLAHSADAAQQILASAQQQMTGMDQVALAMQNIQLASSQNMASTRQVEEAARQLNALSGKLTELVAANGNGRSHAPAVREANAEA